MSNNNTTPSLCWVFGARAAALSLCFAGSVDKKDDNHSTHNRQPPQNVCYWTVDRWMDGQQIRNKVPL